MSVVIRPPFADERAHILRSWIEDYRYAPGQRNRRWRDYEADREQAFGTILDADTTRLLVQAIEDDAGDVILGWLCWTPGTHADIVHWIRTRYRVGREGELLRRRGTMTALFAAANLKEHVGYTFRGPLPRKNEPGPKVSSDTWVVAWLGRRGITAVPAPDAVR